MINKYCANCKTSLNEFYRTGMLGCPDCYKNFRQEIDLTLKKIQGAIYHSGKEPKVSGVDRDLMREYQDLLKEQERLVLNKDFLRIKEISEEISALQAELKNRGLI